MESSAIGHQANVGGQRDREAGTCGCTIDRCDHRDLELLELGREAVAQLGRGQARLALCRDALLAVGEVGAGAETPSGAGDYERASLRFGPQISDHLPQPRADARRERIEHLRPVQGGHDDAVVSSLD